MVPALNAVSDFAKGRTRTVLVGRLWGFFLTWKVYTLYLVETLTHRRAMQGCEAGILARVDYTQTHTPFSAPNFSRDARLSVLTPPFVVRFVIFGEMRISRGPGNPMYTVLRRLSAKRLSLKALRRVQGACIRVRRVKQSNFVPINCK